MAKQVKIYTTPSCPYCKLTKEYFKEQNVSFEEIDVSNDPAKQQEMIGTSGQMGVPVIDVGGTIVVGFDRPKLKELLGLPS